MYHDQTSCRVLPRPSACPLASIIKQVMVKSSDYQLTIMGAQSLYDGKEILPTPGIVAADHKMVDEQSGQR
ncbi:hypothetical protein BgiBS90_024440 [Biomphalaria glabrata]|nr:hypothetical protein BgiBS90_024440 [Biomphalaria glabrata]